MRRCYRLANDEVENSAPASTTSSQLLDHAQGPAGKRRVTARQASARPVNLEPIADLKKCLPKLFIALQCACRSREGHLSIAKDIDIMRNF